MNRKMMNVLEEDGNKLRHFTGQEHGPFIFEDDDRPEECPGCAGLGFWMVEEHDDPVPCGECRGTGLESREKMKPIKLDDMGCDGRLNGMGEPDPEGSYVAITCIEFGHGHDEPGNRATFQISEGQAYELAFGILGALNTIPPTKLIEHLRREVSAFEGADEKTALQAADTIEHLAHALTRIAEWAETADSVEAVNGLPQTAKIARAATK